MDKFTKIILEQLKRGDFGTREASETTLQQLDVVNGGVTAFHFLVILKRGQSFGSRNIVSRGISTTPWNKYNTKDYIYVIGKRQDDPRGKKRMDVYPIWIYKLNENPIVKLDD